MLSIRAALLQLDWPGQRSGNVISHCWMFIWQLEKREVSHMDALSLCRLVMKAHGFQDQELEVFSKRSRDAGTVRKRIRENIEGALDGTGEGEKLSREREKILRELLEEFNQIERG
jgi:hypothetical protein